MGFAQGFATGAGLVNDHFEGLRREKADAEMAKAREAEAADRAERMRMDRERFGLAQKEYEEGAALRGANLAKAVQETDRLAFENSPEERQRRAENDRLQLATQRANADAAIANAGTSRNRLRLEEDEASRDRLAMASYNFITNGVYDPILKDSSLDPERFLENPEQFRSDLQTIQAAAQATASGQTYDQVAAVNAVNRMFRPKITEGIGVSASGKYADRAGVSGWTVVDKNLDSVEVGPNGGMVWNLQVTVSDPKDPKRTRTYLAPVTQGRQDGGEPGEYGIDRFTDYVSSAGAVHSLLTRDQQTADRYRSAIAAANPNAEIARDLQDRRSYADARSQFIQNNKREMQAQYDAEVAAQKESDPEARPMSFTDFQTAYVTEKLGSRDEWSASRRKGVYESPRTVTPSAKLKEEYGVLFGNSDKVYGTPVMRTGQRAAGYSASTAMTMQDIKANAPHVAQLLIQEASKRGQPINPTWLEANRDSLTSRRNDETPEQASKRLGRVIPQLFMTYEQGVQYSQSLRSNKK